MNRDDHGNAGVCIIASMISLQPCSDKDVWNEFVLENGGHPLQLWGWGETKASHGWKAERLFATDMDKKQIGAVQVLVRRLPWPFKSISYVPRGPIIRENMAAEFLEALANYARSQYGSVTLTIEPDWSQLPSIPSGWQQSNNTILIPQTLTLDLNKSEEDLLSAMTKKTRQYIRKSGQEDVRIAQVKTIEGVKECLEVYRETAARADFQLHHDDYYLDLYRNMGEASPVFAVYHEEKPVAFLWLAISQSVAFELYGGMNETGQRLRANYALKWHAICKMREWGIERYDMNGLVSDGVSTFKRGFANHEDLLVGTYDRPLSPLYLLWTRALPLGKKIIRTLNRR